MKKFLSIFLVSMFVFAGCVQKNEEENVVQVETGNVSPAGGAQAKVVVIGDFAFNPKTVTVDQGETVVWRHFDVVAHNIIVPGLFESPSLERGKSFSFKFEKAGMYEYYCSIHPSMRGIVVVK